MYNSRNKSALERAQDKMKSLLKVKRHLINCLKEMEPDGDLTAADILSELELFRTSVEDIAASLIEVPVELDFEDE